MSDGFEEVWKRAVTFRAASPRLRMLFRNVFASLNRLPMSAAAVRAALIELFEFLSTARTDANCSVSGRFFATAEEWASGWSELPAEYRELLSDAGGVLHDAIHAPLVASTFRCLPEQLLERARELPV